MIIKCTSVLNTKWTNQIYWIQLHLHVYVAVIFMISKDGNLNTTCTPFLFCNIRILQYILRNLNKCFRNEIYVIHMCIIILLVTEIIILICIANPLVITAIMEEKKGKF